MLRERAGELRSAFNMAKARRAEFGRASRSSGTSWAVEWWQRVRAAQAGDGPRARLGRALSGRAARHAADRGDDGRFATQSGDCASLEHFLDSCTAEANELDLAHRRLVAREAREEWDKEIKEKEAKEDKEAKVRGSASGRRSRQSSPT